MNQLDKYYLYQMKYKTKEELLAAPREDLTFDEKLVRELLESMPDMTFEGAVESLEMLP